jgi:hypothetical protein
MAIDMGAVQARSDTPDAPRGGWRPRTVIVSILVVVLVAGAVVAYAVRSTPHVVSGSIILPGHGVRQLSDGVDVTRWEQTSDHAWVAWTVRNDGPDTVTLSSPVDPDPLPNVMPRLTTGFLPFPPPFGGTPPQLATTSAATVADLQQSISVASGEEVYVVEEVFYPDACLLVGADAAAGARYFMSTVAAEVRALGRTTTIELALPWRLDTPTRQGSCDLALFPAP